MAQSRQAAQFDAQCTLVRCGYTALERQTREERRLTTAIYISNVCHIYDGCHLYCRNVADIT